MTDGLLEHDRLKTSPPCAKPQLGGAQLPAKDFGAALT